MGIKDFKELQSKVAGEQCFGTSDAYFENVYDFLDFIKEYITPDMRLRDKVIIFSWPRDVYGDSIEVWFVTENIELYIRNVSCWKWWRTHSFSEFKDIFKGQVNIKDN